MVRRVLVPLDGSAFAEQALPFATSIARRAGASLHVVRVHVPPAPLYCNSEFVPELPVDTAVREGEIAYLDGILKQLSETVPGSVSRNIVDGLVGDALYDHAVATGADLVVMATHGRGPVSRFWLGSVADMLVRRLPMPILLIRPDENTPHSANDVSMRRILITLDGSEAAEQILGPATELGSLTNAEYLLLRVVESDAIAARQFPVLQVDHITREAQTYLDAVADRLLARSLRVETRVMINRSPATAILDAAQAWGADLIALETHGRGGIARLGLGSVADKIVRGGLTPLLLHRMAKAAHALPTSHLVSPGVQNRQKTPITAPSTR